MIGHSHVPLDEKTSLARVLVVAEINNILWVVLAGPAALQSHVELLELLLKLQVRHILAVIPNIGSDSTHRAQLNVADVAHGRGAHGLVEGLEPQVVLAPWLPYF